MAAFRDIGRKARRDLHEHMRVPALFAEEGGSAFELIHVRLHTKFDPMKAFAGGQAGLATIQDMQPTIIFDREELASKGLELKRGAILTVAVGEGYKVDNTLAPDDITIAAVVARLSQREMQGLPIPEDA